MQQEVLRARIARLVIDGHLPQLSGLRMWGRRGDGNRCYICNDLIMPNEVQYGIEHNVEGIKHILHVHLDCHKVWVQSTFERETIW